MRHIRAALRSISLGNKRTFQNLTIFPLISPTAPKADYLTLDAALAVGQVRLSEVSIEGRANALKLVNRSLLPVLIIDGQELPDANQNLIANVTVLAPPRTSLTIPVSRAESGRWTVTGTDLVVANRTQHARSRRLRGHGARVVDPYVERFAPQAMQVGAVFAIGDQIEGLELFDSPDTLTAMLPKLVRKYARDALEGTDEPRMPISLDKARTFLRQTLRTTHEECYPAIGLGEEVWAAGRDISGGGLALEGKLLHLATFANAEQTN